MKNAGKRSWLQRTFKLDIVLVFSSLIIVTMVAITSFTYIQNRKASLRLANQVMDQTAQAVIEKTVEYLSPAQSVAELSAELLTAGELELAPNSNIDRYFQRILESYPQIGLIYFGDENGNFIQAHREVETGNLTSRVIDRTRTPAIERFYFRDAAKRIHRLPRLISGYH